MIFFGGRLQKTPAVISVIDDERMGGLSGELSAIANGGGPPREPGVLDFSTPDNSAYLALILEDE